MAAEIALHLYEQLTKDKQPGSEPVLAILMGVSYSGKSTIAKAFTKHGFVHFWATVVKQTYNIGDEEMLDVAQTVIKQLLQNRYRVVFDFTNHTKALRQPFVDLTYNIGCESVICYTDTNRDTLIDRYEHTVKAGATKGRNVIPKKAIDEMTEELEMPEPGQDLIEVKDGDTTHLEKWLNSSKVGP